MLLPLRPKRVPQGSLVHGIGINLIPKISGIADPLNHAGTHPHGHHLHIHEFEGVARHILTRDRAEDISRPWAGNLKTRTPIRDVLKRNALLEILAKPALVSRLISIRCRQLELVFCQRRYREVSDQTASGREHRGKANSSYGWNSPGHDAIQPLSCTLTTQ